MTTLIQAPPDKVRRLKAFREEKRQRDRQRLANVDAFKVLGYEPTCLPRRAPGRAPAEAMDRVVADLRSRRADAARKSS